MSLFSLISVAIAIWFIRRCSGWKTSVRKSVSVEIRRALEKQREKKTSWKRNRSSFMFHTEFSVRQRRNWGCHQTTTYFFSCLWNSLLVSFLCTRGVICLSWPQRAGALRPPLNWQRCYYTRKLSQAKWICPLFGAAAKKKLEGPFFVPAVINLINILIMNKGWWSDGHASSRSGRYFGEVCDKSLFVKRPIGFQRACHLLQAHALLSPRAPLSTPFPVCCN